MTELLVIGACLLIGGSSVLYTFLQVRKIDSMLRDFAMSFTEDNNEALSVYELQEMERAMAFEQRIQRMKEELATQESFQRPTYVGTIAEELHPHVKNLPHSIIESNTPSNDSEEYAE